MNPRYEITAPAGSLEEAEAYMAAGADAVVVGEERFAPRLPGSMEPAAILEAVSMAAAQGKRVYVSATALLHPSAASDAEPYVARLREIGVDAVQFADPAMAVAAKRAAPEMKLHWDAGTIAANWRTANFWAKRGASRALLARELSIEEALEARRRASLDIQLQVHGPTCIFHSKRALLDSYDDWRGVEPSKEGAARWLLEEKRSGERRYPIFEDRHGTHVMNDEDLCMIEHLGKLLDAGVQAYYIETWGRPLEANARTIATYRQAIDSYVAAPEAWSPDPVWFETLARLQTAQRPLGTGFYFKRQAY
ncbi:U32 family peptidase [Paenibacillus sp. TRM 82003]|nr:U32 family peptidase [Paenibacillus sp. TRM 82003]